MTDIEPLGPADVDGLADLADACGWGRMRSRWQLTFSHAQVWAIRADDAGLLGTVSLYRPSGGLSVVGAMLVRPDHQRRGLGRALLAHVGAQSAEPLMLYATTDGEPLYRSEGWTDREVVHVHQGDGPPGSAAAGARRRGIDVGPADGEALDLLVALDAQAAMGDRSALLRDVATFPGALVATARSGGAAGLAWPQQDGQWGIGPLPAFDDPGALGVAAVLVEAARAAGATRFRIDLGSEQVGLRTWCSARGIPEVRTTPGLVLRAGEATVPAPSAARRALFTQGFG